MIAIINYGIGNLASVLNMFKRIGADAVITANADEIEKADKLILPGVGFFDSCMQAFNQSKLREAVEQKVLIDKTPILGICVGAQMMTKGSEEGTQKGLGWVDASTVRFKIDATTGLKIPNMGWSDLIIDVSVKLLENLPEVPRFYFAHSYHFKFEVPEQIIASAVYGYQYPVAFQKNNIAGTQFHPEKSHKYGMKLLENFSKL